MSAILRISIRLLEACFAIGIIGSAIVFVLATIEDVQVLFSKEKKITD